MINTNKFYTAHEVSEVFFECKVSYQKVLRMTKKGLLPGTKYGKSYLYHKDGLRAWLKNFNDRGEKV